MDLGIYEGIYDLKQSICGFEYGKKYIFKLDKKPNTSYEIQELENDLFLVLSSEISIRRYFKDLKKND